MAHRGRRTAGAVEASTVTTAPANFLGLRALSALGPRLAKRSTAELIKSWSPKGEDTVMSGGVLNEQIIVELKNHR